MSYMYLTTIAQMVKKVRMAVKVFCYPGDYDMSTMHYDITCMCIVVDLHNVDVCMFTMILQNVLY